ncbi:MAG: hypothetical protein KBD64_03985 [Gammaproteobacteria bacterium]|nr:hypothetical protein [Gammaproteobacteria bacterium]
MPVSGEFREFYEDFESDALDLACYSKRRLIVYYGECFKHESVLDTSALKKAIFTYLRPYSEAERCESDYAAEVQSQFLLEITTYESGFFNGLIKFVEQLQINAQSNRIHLSAIPIAIDELLRQKKKELASSTSTSGVIFASEGSAAAPIRRHIEGLESLLKLLRSAEDLPRISSTSRVRFE